MVESYDEDGTWISLQEASERLGVAASTVRRWGDEGRVPMKKTLGGHRRFNAAAIERLTHNHHATLLPTHAATEQTWGVNDQEIARQEWHARFATHGGAERMRGLGQRLLGLLVQYVNRRSDETRFLAEARGVGADYGANARETDISLYDTVEAFLFFRSAFARLAQPIPGIPQPSDLEEATALRERIDRFMDTVLLGLINGYGQQP